MAKDNKWIWIIIIIIVLYLISIGIIDLNQIFSIERTTSFSTSGFGGGII